MLLLQQQPLKLLKNIFEQIIKMKGKKLGKYKRYFFLSCVLRFVVSSQHFPPSVSFKEREGVCSQKRAQKKMMKKVKSFYSSFSLSVSGSNWLGLLLLSCSYTTSSSSLSLLF